MYRYSLLLALPFFAYSSDPWLYATTIYHLNHVRHNSSFAEPLEQMIGSTCSVQRCNSLVCPTLLSTPLCCANSRIAYLTLLDAVVKQGQLHYGWQSFADGDMCVSDQRLLAHHKLKYKGALIMSPCGKADRVQIPCLEKSIACCSMNLVARTPCYASCLLKSAAINPMCGSLACALAAYATCTLCTQYASTACQQLTYTVKPTYTLMQADKAVTSTPAIRDAYATYPEVRSMPTKLSTPLFCILPLFCLLQAHECTFDAQCTDSDTCMYGESFCLPSYANGCILAAAIACLPDCAKLFR